MHNVNSLFRIDIVKKISGVLHEVTLPWIVMCAKIKAMTRPPLRLDPSWSDVSDTVELRVVTCARDIVPTICSIKSFFYSSRLKMNIYIHSDETVSWLHKMILRYHLRNVRFIERQDECLVDVSKYPFVSKLRCSWQGKKLVDMYLMKKAPKLLILDSDVYFYRSPKEIIQWIKHGERNLITEDYKSFNILSKAEYSQYLGVNRIHHNINTGILGLTDGVYLSDLKFIEKYLKVAERVLKKDRKLTEDDVYSELNRMSKHLLEQSVFCYLFSLSPVYSVLSRSRYLMYPRVFLRYVSRPFYPHLPVAIHYAGQATRRNFYLDYLLQNQTWGSLYRRIYILYERIFRLNALKH